MKHNSAIKQMMREVNTQVALKETEIDYAVKETIGKTVKTDSYYPENKNILNRFYFCNLT